MDLEVRKTEIRRGRLVANWTLFSYRLPIRAWETSAGVMQCLGSECTITGTRPIPFPNRLILGLGILGGRSLHLTLPRSRVSWHPEWGLRRTCLLSGERRNEEATVTNCQDLQGRIFLRRKTWNLTKTTSRDRHDRLLFCRRTLVWFVRDVPLSFTCIGVLFTVRSCARQHPVSLRLAGIIYVNILLHKSPHNA
jgi:hypothetical protein